VDSSTLRRHQEEEQQLDMEEKKSRGGLDGLLRRKPVNAAAMK